MLPLLSSALIILLTFGVLFYYVVFGFALRLLGTHLLRRTSAKREAVLRQLPDGVKDKGRIVGFFHPYCNAGGGGERVLWAAIKAVQATHRHVMSIVYTGDLDATKDEILSRVVTRFSISLDPTTIIFLYLSKRYLVAPVTWPRFTLAGQSIGSVALAYEAFSLLVPDAFIDTMGYAFTLPLAKALFRMPTAAYVHYPTISTDMLSSLPTTMSLGTHAKRLYWRLFALAYSCCGPAIDRVMVNSSWTRSHILHLWPTTTPLVLFPPCAVTPLLASTTASTPRSKHLLCIAQFRPEKSHPLLLRSFSRFHTHTSAHKDARLVLVGSVRHDSDAKRVYDLRLLARELGVAENIDFVCDAPWSDVMARLANASVGINGMWNEHFGIGVVEYQAAGLVCVVHNSGGPREDIVRSDAGWWAEDEQSFADAFETALSVHGEEMVNMRQAARENSRRFGEEEFENGWNVVFAEVMDMVEIAAR